jgi:SAM-dependent methyltransferase
MARSESVPVYEQIIDELRRSYDGMVEERDRKEIAAWKMEERQHFLSLLQKEGKKKLLEIGAGTGVHGKFFQDSGLEVICTDLSPEMVKRCRKKGLSAYAMDFLTLGFPDGSFEAVYALNCLLHVSKRDLPRVLGAVRGLLQSDGLFYWGQYGGIEREGPWPGDHYEPKRFFSFLTDDQIREIATRLFELVSFKQVQLEGDDDFHFQSMVLRRT